MRTKIAIPTVSLSTRDISSVRSPTQGMAYALDKVNSVSFQICTAPSALLKLDTVETCRWRSMFRRNMLPPLQHRYWRWFLRNVDVHLRYYMELQPIKRQSDVGIQHCLDFIRANRIWAMFLRVFPRSLDVNSGITSWNMSLLMPSKLFAISLDVRGQDSLQSRGCNYITKKYGPEQPETWSLLCNPSFSIIFPYHSILDFTQCR
jgi:hypothetical protein